MKYLQSEEVFGHAAPQPPARLQPGVWHSSWPRVSSPLCVQDDCFGIQTVERDRGEDWGCLSIVSDLCRDQGELLAQGLRMVSCWWQALLGKVSAAQHWGDRGPKRVQCNGFFFLLDRITWFISTKSIWSYSSSTFKHFANEFSIIIPNLQTRRLRLRQQIHLVQSQTMGGHWKLILWDLPDPLFTEQPTWNKIIFFLFFFLFSFLNR